MNKKNKSIRTKIFFLSLIFLLNALHADALPRCKTGPECDAIQSLVDEIKTVKISRHEDVLKHGRKSAEVKKDDQTLADLAKRDHELRHERKTEIQASAHAKPHRHRPLGSTSRHSFGKD